MEDIIDIIVTETTNLIEITSQSTDEVIDVNIIDNREDITLNVTPSLVEININSLTGNFGVEWGDITGTLADQTDLNTALGLKADLVGGKVPSSQLPSYVDDVVEVATYSALPATGETGKIYVVLDTNKIYRWSGSVYVEIADSTAVWGAITGTLSSQTDLQNALNAKFNNPTGDSTQYLNGAGTPVTFPIAGQAGTLVREVRNTTGATLTKGTIVYISGATGNKPTVSKALATGDSTSAQTFGLCQADIANNANGYVVCVGDIVGLDTSAISEGVQLYLSSTTAGTYTTTKQLAPAHLVYIGVVTRSHPTQGQIEVKIQNGYELDEIHDVAISSKANNDGLFYESSTNLWKNKSIATVLGYSPEQPLTFSSPLSRSTNAVSILAATSSANGYLTSTDWTTFNAKQAALSGTGFVKISGTTISYDNSTYLTTSSASSTYLAKTGGTLTGSLNGTTAVFSGAVWGQTGYFSNTTADNALAIFQSNASYHAVTITNSGSGGSALYISGGSTFAGTVNITGVLTAQSGLANGSGQSFTLPSTTGTLALTSQLSSYLPLSGGTLTGALSGTSGNFSGNINTDGRFVATTNLSTPSDANVYLYKSSAGAVISGYQFIAETGGLGSRATRLTIDNAGAATFSSSVTATAIYATDATGSAILTTNGGGEGILSVNTANPLRILINGGEKVRVTSSGNVGIGTTSPGAKLDLGSTYGAPKLLLYNDGTYVNGFGIYANEFRNFFDTIDAASSRMTWGKQTAGGTFTEFMRLTKDGNVGIGTTAPGMKLDVIGGSGLSGTAYGVVRGVQDKTDYRGAVLGYDTNGQIGLVYSESNGSPSALAFWTYSGSSWGERMRISSDGRVTIGDTSTNNSGKFEFASPGVGSYNGVMQLFHSTSNNTSSGYINFYINNTVIGSINQNGTSAIAYNTTSDYRLKEDLKPINGLEIVNKIKVYDYKWKAEDRRMDGVLAHELAEILPYAVTGEKDGERMQGVDYSKIVPVMVQAIKELKAELDILKNK